jgi:hypothetical protein
MSFWLNIFIIFAVVIIYIQFAVRTNRLKRSLPFFPTSLVVSMIISVLAALTNIITVDPLNNRLFALQITFTGLGFIVFYLFIENMIQLNRDHVKFSILCSLVSVFVVLQWIIAEMKILFRTDKIIPLMRFLADFTYYLSGIFVFGFTGLPFWLKLYKKSKRYQFLILFVSSYTLIVGFVLLSIGSYEKIIMGASEEEMFTLDAIGSLISFTGLGILYLLISIDFIHLYYFPQENYGLIISNSSGIVLFFIKFNNEHSKAIEEDLISGFLSAMNSMFQESFQAKKSVRYISSESAELFMEKGKYVSVAFFAERISGLIGGELKAFLNDFESKFEIPLKNQSTRLDNYNNAIDLVKSRFPYFEIAE